ncbi:MAG: amidohydrolase [Solobacterium sp.]|nr:amidohydrolase [Solobacterium sp.]MBR0478810.1 amidohydrolase [Solobacterium sp.]
MNKQEIKETVIEIRHHLHTIPELALQEYKTSKYIAEKMREFGFDVTEGIGGTGVVATLKCGTSGRMIGLRADFDALPITETADVPYRSTHEGCFHGCGHDSHVASMIGAALLLKESQDFDGTVVFVFQPGEEPGVGARAMIADGLLEKYPMTEIYGQHNDPMTPIGRMGVRVGMASSSEDDFWITIKGRGGHASAPHNVKDPLVTAAEVITALQTIVSRNINPLEAGTVSCCDVQTDGVLNAIPSTVTIVGDCRTYNKNVQKLIEDRMRTIVQHICEMNDCEWELKYDHAFVPLDNNAECVAAVIEAGKKVFGEENVDGNCPMMSASEDFAWYQESIPGAFFFVGHKAPDNDHPAPLHNSGFIYNDDAILNGSEMFAQIVRDRMPA